MSRVVLITTEPVPLPGWPTTGTGLRAWSLAGALRERGHDLTLLMAEDCLEGYRAPEGCREPDRDLPDWVATFDRKASAGSEGEARIITEHGELLEKCDVVIAQHWGVVRHLPELHVPLALDLAGPHLLERRHWGSPSPELDLAEKLDALRRADFVTVCGRVQRLYFLPFLQMAGWEIETLDASMPITDFSISRASEPAPVRGDRFIFGGYLLPWQDPSAALQIVMDAMAESDKGELVFIGGAHPHADVSGGKFDAILRRLREHPRVSMLGPQPYEEFSRLLAEGGIALDLMARNTERELAVTSRTVQYLAAGLPVIYNDYSELSGAIGDAEAGWTLAPDDDKALRDIVTGLLTGTIDPGPQAEAAYRLAGDRFDPARSIDELDGFCRSPLERPGKVAARLAFEERDRRLARAEADLARTTSRLETLRGKRWVRWGLNLLSTRGVFALPIALLAIVLGAALLPIFYLNDRFGK